MAIASVHYNVWTELEQVLNRTLENQFPNLTFHNGIDVPTTFDLQPGAQTVSSELISVYGEAALMGVRSNDVPLVKITMSKGSAPVVMAVAGWSLDFQSQRSYNFSGKAGIVSDRSVKTVRRVLDEKLHYYAAYGDLNLGSTGLLNKSGVTTSVSTYNVNSTATTAFSDTLDYLMAMVLDMAYDTRNVFGEGLTILAPAKAFNKMARITDPQDTSVNVFKAFYDRLRAMGAGYESVQILPRFELDSAMLEQARFGVMASGTNRDRWVVYAKNPDVCARQMEEGMAQLFPQEFVRPDENGAIVYPMFQVASETQVYTTNAIKYIDAPKAA